MVVFTCNNCGETLQKPRVAKHYQFQCRTAAFLTCVDCFKDFRGDEYVGHTKCITEAERYGGKDYVPKAGTNKGEKKQQQWLNVVNNLLGSTTELSHAERNFLNALSKHENIPRKKAKFLNFIRSALGNKANMAIVDSVWAKMEAAHKQATESTTQSQSNAGTNVQNGEHVNETFPQEEESISAENQNNENICKENNSEDKEERVIDSGAMNGEPEKIPNRKEKKKSKKRGLSESMEESEEQPVSKRKIKNVSVLSKANENEVTSNTPTFKWKEVIVNIVQNKGEISLKKLQKKVVSQYMAYCSDILTHEKAVNKFNKKLKKIPGIEVSEERVRIM